ncbi:hypothetical protein V8E51_002136 [Hyaloscypha variabilis]
MAPTSSIRVLEPDNYEWKQLVISSQMVWRRPPLANEAMWLARSQESRDLFVYAVLKFEAETTSKVLSSAAASAWRQLRFDIPELVLTAGTSTKDEKPYLQYENPQHESEVDDWVKRTLRIDLRNHDRGFNNMRDKVIKLKRGCTDNVFLFVRTKNDDYNPGKDGLLQVMIYLDHLVTDGIGARIVLGRYLSLLASSIVTPINFKPDWQKNHENLSAPWIGLLRNCQELSGPSYEEGVLRNRDIMITRMHDNHGFPLTLPETQSQVATGTGFLTFHDWETEPLLEKVKELFNSNSVDVVVGSDSEDEKVLLKPNITHLGHAAMILALLRLEPLPLPNVPEVPCPVYSPCWFNGRRYLKPTASQTDPLTNYIPLCLSFAPIEFPDLRKLLLSARAEKEEIKTQLVKACRIATERYMNIGKGKDMFSTCVELLEEFGERMRRELPLIESEQTNSLEPEVEQTSTDTTDQQDTPPENESSTHSLSTPEAIAVDKRDPFFLSDGIIENFIDRKYFVKSRDAEAKMDEKVLFRVICVKFTANADRNIIVRMSSWRDRITLQAEWRKSDYDEIMIKRFLEDIKKIMLSILD